VEGLLGPADRLEVRWSAGAATHPAQPAGSVEGVLLWDAQPAGDHILARLTYRNPGGTSTVRLGLAPGMVLRTNGLPGLVDTGWQGTDERPEWVASFDPPLPDGAAIPIEFWRPVPPAEPPGRSFPWIEPIGMDQYGGTLAFRRPAEWSGRLAAGAGSGFEPMTDEAFVRTWGNLSDEPLTLAGTVRFARTPVVTLATGPPPQHVLVEPELRLALEPGRMALDLRASLTATSGRCDHVELAIPRGLAIVAVESDGLTDWNDRAPDRIHLRFDGPPQPRREVRIQAWIPLPTEPLRPGPAHQEGDVPWLRWLGVDERPGLLTVVSPTPFQLREASGLTPTPAAAGVGSYRVERPDARGRLSWEVEPPRVEVLVESQLTILPEFAEWVAVARYTVAGASAEAIYLKLPSAWADAAQLQVVGDTHELTTDPRGANTLWRIRTGHPIWGSQRLIVRATMPLPPSGTLGFPALSPLGLGEADTYLSLVNATGHSLVTEGSPGLQPIVDENKFRAGEFAGYLGIAPSLYRVRRGSWSLQVQWPTDRPAGERADAQARVLLADLACSLRPDGSVTGLASFEVATRSGPFLAVDLPGQSEPVWAVVERTPVPPLRAASGRWLIPLGATDTDDDHVEVRLAWKASPTPGAPAPAGGELRPLPLPVLNQPRVPLFVTVHAPAGLEVESASGALEAAPRERLEIHRFEWLGKQVASSLLKLDRSSLRDCEVLVSDLVQFELLLRDADRAAVWNRTSPVTYRDARIDRVQERVRIARHALDEALRNAGLEEFAHAARIHVGLEADDPDSSALEVPEPVASVRVRRLGRPRFFQGESSVNERSAPLGWHTSAGRPPSDTPYEWLLLPLAVLAALLSARLVLQTPGGVRTRWLGPVALICALAVVASLAGPLALAGGLAMAWLGWRGGS
jgi:hypothetical protein